MPHCDLSDRSIRWLHMLVEIILGMLESEYNLDTTAVECAVSMNATSPMLRASSNNIVQMDLNEHKPITSHYGRVEYS